MRQHALAGRSNGRLAQDLPQLICVARESSALLWRSSFAACSAAPPALRPAANVPRTVESCCQCQMHSPAASAATKKVLSRMILCQPVPDLLPTRWLVRSRTLNKIIDLRYSHVELGPHHRLLLSWRSLLQRRLDLPFPDQRWQLYVGVRPPATNHASATRSRPARHIG